MRLQLFDKIDSTVEILKNNKEIYDGLRKELKFTFLDALKDNDYVLTIASRIKTADSLREKLIRNRFYLIYDTPQEIIDNLSDIIGLKIECRFIEEEEKVYNNLKNCFIEDREDGFNGCDKYPNVFLNVNDKQPQVQRNGHPIYRIDGYYLNDKNKIRFELQIKSLVNSFWGDIEHKLVYKNTNYDVFDDFMREILSSINSNLSIIDKQLSIVYQRMNNKTPTITRMRDRLSLDIVIAKAINDLFTEKLRDSVGFTINLKETSLILAHYLLNKNIKNIEEEDDHTLALLKLFKKFNNETIDFSDELTFEEEFNDDRPFISTLGNYLIDQINVDFSWHVFFRILFSIEPGNNFQDFTLFLSVLREYMIDENFELSFSKLKGDDQRKVQDELLKMLANSLIENGTIKIILDDNLIAIKKIFNNYVKELEGRVIDYKDFTHFSGVYYEKLSEQINSIFK